MMHCITSEESTQQGEEGQLIDNENVTTVTASPRHGIGTGLGREQFRALLAQAKESGERVYLAWNKKEGEGQQ